jgi:hypothetical protein
MALKNMARFVALPVGMNRNELVSIKLVAGNHELPEDRLN